MNKNQNKKYFKRKQKWKKISFVLFNVSFLMGFHWKGFCLTERESKFYSKWNCLLLKPFLSALFIQLKWKTSSNFLTNSTFKMQWQIRGMANWKKCKANIQLYSTNPCFLSSVKGTNISAKWRERRKKSFSRNFSPFEKW